MNLESDNPASRARSPQQLRTTQSMYQSPTAAPAHQPLRRVVTSPPVCHPPPVYGPDPNLMYGPPPPVPMYSPPNPYIPQYPHNTSMYYPPPVAQPQMFYQNQMIPPYENHDPNFAAFFGPDVRPQPAQSPVEEQRKQFQNYSRNRPIQSNNQYASRSGISVRLHVDTVLQFCSRII